MNAAEGFVGHPLPDPIELGPEYDAYQMRRRAEELCALPDDQFAVCEHECRQTMMALFIRLRRLTERRAA